MSNKSGGMARGVMLTVNLVKSKSPFDFFPIIFVRKSCATFFSPKMNVESIKRVFTHSPCCVRLKALQNFINPIYKNADHQCDA